MQSRKALNESTLRAKTRHADLQAMFAIFARHVEAGITDPFGMVPELHLDEGYFILRFAGRTVYFQFCSVPNDNGTLGGKVHCFLKTELPEPTVTRVGEFTFTPNGQTNLMTPDEEDQVFIDNEFGALQVALDLVRESLSR